MARYEVRDDQNLTRFSSDSQREAKERCDQLADETHRKIVFTVVRVEAVWSSHTVDEVSGDPPQTHAA